MLNCSTKALMEHCSIAERKIGMTKDDELFVKLKKNADIQSRWINFVIFFRKFFFFTEYIIIEVYILFYNFLKVSNQPNNSLEIAWVSKFERKYERMKSFWFKFIRKSEGTLFTPANNVLAQRISKISIEA